MNKVISELIDRYALNQLHKEKSIVSHFNLKSTKPIPMEDAEKFYAEPAMPNLKFLQKELINNYSIGNFNYTSEIQNNNKSNNSVIGYFHKNLNNKKAVNVILVHGWRMHNITRVDNIYLDKFVELGFNIYHFLMPYHFERISSNSKYNGELMVTADIDRTLLSIQQAVSDLRALIKWLKADSNGKVILIGVSLGGFLTNLTSAVEKEIDLLISVFYANSLAHSVWNTIPGKYIRKDFDNSSFPFEKLMLYWSIIEPSLFKPAISKEKILLLSAYYDKYIDFEDSNKLWLAWDKPKRIVYKCGHAGIALCKNKIASDSLEFITR